MTITYLYHSGFAIEEDNILIIIDFWQDPAGVLPALLMHHGPIYVLATHFHPDHFNRDIFNWATIRPDIQYILSKDILRRHRVTKEEARFIVKGDIYQDDNIRIQALGSTDSGISFYIKLSEHTIFHAGDLNNWHWQEISTKAESSQHEKMYLGELKDIMKVLSDVDILFFPIDSRLGKEYMRGAEQFIEKIGVKHFIPMHFTANPIEKAAGFASIAESYGTKFHLLKEAGDNLII